MPETELLNFYVRGEPMPQPRPRASIIRVHGKPHVHIYDRLEQYEKLPNGKRGARKKWDAAYWRDRIIERTKAACVGVQGLPIEGPIRLDLDFYFPRPGYMLSSKYPVRAILHTGRPDVDNLFKLVADAITQAGWAEIAGVPVKTPLVWSDDGQVCDTMIKKWYVARGDAAGVRVVVTRLQDPEPSLLENFSLAGARP